MNQPDFFGLRSLGVEIAEAEAMVEHQKLLIAEAKDVLDTYAAQQWAGIEGKNAEQRGAEYHARIENDPAYRAYLETWRKAQYRLVELNRDAREKRHAERAIVVGVQYETAMLNYRAATERAE